MWSVNDLFISTGSHSFCPVGMDSNYDQIFLQNPVCKEVEVEAVKSDQEPQNDNLFNWPPQNSTMQMTPTFAPSYASYPYMQQMYYSYANYPFSTTTTPWTTQQGYTAPLVQTPPLSPSSPSLREKEITEPKVSPMRVPEKKTKRQTNTIHAMCKLCQKEEFNTGHMSMIMSHLAFHDKSLSRYACTICGMAFTRRDKVKEHIASKCEGGKLEIKQDEQYKSKLRRWAAQCFPESLVERIMDQCSKEAEKFLRLNKEQPSNSNMIKCRKCDKEVQNSPGSRSHHAKTHSKMKQYECSSCGHQGHMKDNLKVHSIKRHQRLVPIKDLFNNQMMEEYAKLHEECFPPEDRKNASKQTTVQAGDFDAGQYPLSTIQPTSAYGFPSPATTMNPAFPSVSWPSMTMPTMLWSGFQQMNAQNQLPNYEQS